MMITQLTRQLRQINQAIIEQLDEQSNVELESLATAQQQIVTALFAEMDAQPLTDDVSNLLHATLQLNESVVDRIALFKAKLFREKIDLKRCAQASQTYEQTEQL